MGGSTLEEEPEYMYQPLLTAVYQTGVWDTQNIVRSLMASEVIARTGSPRFSDEGNNPKEADIDYLHPERIAKPAPGNTLRELSTQEMDAALANVEQIMAAQIDKSTVSRILQGGGNLPTGIAFATLNLATQSALGVLKPFKDLAQKGLAEIFTLMLLWTEHTGEPLYALSNNKKDKKSRGQQMMVDPKDIDPKAIYIEVEMHPDAPTDRQQRVNTAVVAVERLDMPIADALEEIGVTDPSLAMKKRLKERWVRHYTDLMMQKQIAEMQAGVQIQTQQAIMEMQQAQMQAQQQAQQEAQMQGGGMGMEGSPMGMSGAIPPGINGGWDVAIGPGGAAQGQGINPAMGGMTPATGAPEETREMMGGEDLMGNETML
jgi:hypothetical protein